ncbi:non-heme iron oxygenase ferredoxin subunit [Granulicoccus phenolivorans]|uniref:non-heme iron oxygenase ferredoxin subunit n=1 Tax=Granulicoccus phenolivorans TaxID=266854 RepID=UPI00047E300E|nr:non-heme iron oxygenase ferredoxin subunit [Granulicoccus phenolivorans]
MSEPVAVAQVNELEPESAIRIPADRCGATEDIALVRAEDGTFYAISDLCTHAEVSLSEGFVEGSLIECPGHGSQFCLRNGHPQMPPANVPVRTYPVEVRGDQVWLTPVPNPVEP